MRRRRGSSGRLERQDLDRVFQEYFKRVYNYLYFKTLDAAVAEDVTGDVMYKVARSYASFDTNRGSLDDWMFRIARNALYSHFRRMKTVVDIDAISEGAFAVSDSYDFGEREQVAKELLVLLNDEERELVFLKFWEQLPNTEIAKRLDMNASTVSTKLSRAVAKMRKKTNTMEI